MPINIHPDTILAEKTCSSRDLVCSHPSDPDKWPKDAPIPAWARRKFIGKTPSTVKGLVDEYLRGLPHPPAIRDLEMVHGPRKIKNPKAKGGFPSWRYSPSVTEDKRRRKVWSERKGVHRFIDLDPQTAETRLAQYIADGWELPEGTNPAEPGAFYIRQAYLQLKKELDPEGNHKVAATKRAETRKRNRTQSKMDEN